mmetsp:Transcript_5630/g.13661  ORF Transcript_5630/g.13661 Transcript_5630/m.13661 type:complete len:294 (-) Transcript_5630:70-951(-)
MERVMKGLTSTISPSASARRTHGSAAISAPSCRNASASSGWRTDGKRWPSRLSSGSHSHSSLNESAACTTWQLGSIMARTATPLDCSNASFMLRDAPMMSRTSSTARSSTSSRVLPERSALARLPERTACDAGNISSSWAHLRSDASRSRRFRCASSVRRPLCPTPAPRPFTGSGEIEAEPLELVRKTSCALSGDPRSASTDASPEAGAPPEAPAKPNVLLTLGNDSPPSDGNRLCSHELGRRPSSLPGTCWSATCGCGSGGKCVDVGENGTGDVRGSAALNSTCAAACCCCI